MPEPRQSEKSPDAFRTISEVADDLELPQHVLRFWETRFTQIKPVKRAGGRRFYRPDDVDLLRGIRHLLYSEGYTIKGVQKILKDNGVRHVQGIGLDSDGAPYHVQDLEPPAPPAAPRSDAPTGFGGILGFLPRRRGKGADASPADAASAHFEPQLSAPPGGSDQPSLFGEPLDDPRGWTDAPTASPGAGRPDLGDPRPQRAAASPRRAPAVPPERERRDPAWDVPDEPRAPVQRSLWAEPSHPEPTASGSGRRSDTQDGWQDGRRDMTPDSIQGNQLHHAAMPPYDRRPASAGDAFPDPAPFRSDFASDPYAGGARRDISDARDFAAHPYGAPVQSESLRRQPEPPRPVTPRPVTPQPPPAPIVQRRPTRGPASRIPEPPMKPELEDPLLPFFDDEALAPPEQQISEPLEARIRRMKDHPASPPEEYIPARARRRDVYEPPFVPLEPAPGLGPFSGPMEEYDPHAAEPPAVRTGLARDLQSEPHAEFGWPEEEDWAGSARAAGPAFDPRTEAPPRREGAAPLRGPLRQGPPEQYLPPHLRSDPRMVVNPPAQPVPVLSRDDVHRLQATLYELGECRRLLTAASALKDDPETAD